MRKERWLYGLLGVLFVLYVAVEYYSPKPISWVISLLANDKNPYGCYILDERLPDLFPEADRSYLTLYELKDSTDQLMILAENLEMDRLDQETLLTKVSQGHSALLGSFYFSEKLLDTLGLDIQYRPFEQINRDTIEIQTTTETLAYSSQLFKSWLEIPDSSAWTVLARSEDPIIAYRQWGEGRIVISASPLIFSNYGMIQNHRLAEQALNLLEYSSLHTTLFYHTGKPQNTSTFRYILTEVSLRWALYLTLALIALLLIINSQRRQQMIPIVEPPKNTTVNFIKTLAALFYREKNHKKAAEKLAGYFLHDLQKRFIVHPDFSESYYALIAKKTNTDKADIIKVMEQIQHIQRAPRLNEASLNRFYQDITAITNSYHGKGTV